MCHFLPFVSILFLSFIPVKLTLILHLLSSSNFYYGLNFGCTNLLLIPHLLPLKVNPVSLKFLYLSSSSSSGHVLFGPSLIMLFNRYPNQNFTFLTRLQYLYNVSSPLYNSVLVDHDRNIVIKIVFSFDFRFRLQRFG